MEETNKDIKLLILVATEQERKILISEEVEKLPIEVIVTGIGSNSVINSVREYCYDAVPVLNIGLVAGTQGVPKDTIIPVTAVMPGFNHGHFQQPISLTLLSKENAYPCVSAPGFITDVYQFFPESCYSHDYVVDMELYTIASFFKDTSALKVVSDDGEFDDYLSTIEDYDSLAPVRQQIYQLICRKLIK